MKPKSCYKAERVLKSLKLHVKLYMKFPFSEAKIHRVHEIIKGRSIALCSAHDPIRILLLSVCPFLPNVQSDPSLDPQS